MHHLRSKLLKRFEETLEKVHKISKIPKHEITRDLYVRYCVDYDIKGRLNKEELNLLGGWKNIKEKYFPELLEIEPFKILFLDIEVKPTIAMIWDAKTHFVPHNNILNEWCVLSFAAKFHNEDKIYYQDVMGKSDDKEVLEKVRELMDKADVIVTHNGDAFDFKKLNSRFLYHNIKPPKKFISIDTKTILKSRFGFLYNSLDYIAKLLKLKNLKSKHSKFSGIELWRECLSHKNKEAFEELKEYNIQDVKVLEELFLEKLAPWDRKLNPQVLYHSCAMKCVCGNNEFEESGFEHTKVSKFKIYRCTKCGKIYRNRKNSLSKKKREFMLTT